MNINHKKWISLVIAIFVFLLAWPLLESGTEDSGLASSTQQSERHVRKWGESGFTGFGTSKEGKRDAAPVTVEAGNAKK